MSVTDIGIIECPGIDVDWISTVFNISYERNQVVSDQKQNKK